MSESSQLNKERDRIQQDERFQPLSDDQQTGLMRVLLCSPWLQRWIKDKPDWSAVWDYFLSDVDATAELDVLTQQWTPDSEALVMKDLRVWRNRHIARLMVRDVLHLNSVAQTALAVSDLADCALEHARVWSANFIQIKAGKPALCPFSKTTAQLIVIAMGKHGARELNLSSDIDLIFAYPNHGETDKGRTHEEYFTRVGRKIIHLLDARTADGFVFRVDMRLRPWGQSGALVSNFSALENYYLQHARFWERFAMVKARVVTGPEVVKHVLTSIIKPFVYRHYVDYQAVGALRELKTKIQTEVRRQNLERNIKLGRGGIREVEFIAQVFQLIRGGQEESLQVEGTWPVLKQLNELKLLPEQVVSELTSAYDFLRDLEHRIQAINDEQTQNLPTDTSDLERLCLSMGLAAVSDFMLSLDSHRHRVNDHFSALIQEDVSSPHKPSIERFIVAWQAKDPTESGALAEAIADFRSMPMVASLPEASKQNLDGFMPMLWSKLSDFQDGERKFKAIRPILEAIIRRSAYFVLLTENPDAISELIALVDASIWIANFIKEKPFLLDELTDRSSLYQLPDRAVLMDDLHQLLLRVPEDDLERQMEVLRHFRHGRVLRAAACEVSQHLPLMKISDYLAWVAEVVVEQALALVWRQMIGKYGRPSKDDGEWCDTDFGIIAYGKMGGIELSYESDLDLVFLHNASAHGVTEGPKSIDNVVFMARLGQKLIHMLAAVTPSGRLYEVDTRLRPSGNSGMLVSRLSAFMYYQRKQAWTWEHQALVRSRFIAGDPLLKQSFDQFREEMICSYRERSTLREEVIEMRRKMKEHLSTEHRGPYSDNDFDIKHDSGGIVDLEFLVQYFLLAHAHDHPGLARWPDNVRSIVALSKEGFLSKTEKDQWLHNYLSLRQALHSSILSGGSSTVKASELPDQIQEVIRSVKQSIDFHLLNKK